MKKVIVGILIICVLGALYGCADRNNNSDDRESLYNEDAG